MLLDFSLRIAVNFIKYLYVFVETIVEAFALRKYENPDTREDTEHSSGRELRKTLIESWSCHLLALKQHTK